MKIRQIGRMMLALALAMMLAGSAAAETYTVLRPGDSGSNVRRLQEALNELGYSTGGIDGQYGSATEASVRLFQTKYGLTVDGKAGPNTLKKLYGITEGTEPTATKKPASNKYFGGDYSVIEYGDQGARVKLLQQALKDLKYTSAKPDGKFGKDTEAMVIAFQEEQGLGADGKAGQKTLKRIEEMLENGETAGSTPTPTPTQTKDPSATNTPGRTLRKGYSGSDVKQVQTRLKELGYYSGAIDGVYGTGSVAAVTAFQKRNGLTADGLAGTSTYKKLFSDNAIAANEATPTPTATATPVPTLSRTLKLGYSGNDVKQVQTRLKELGYYTGTADGKYGEGTMAAVEAFQRRNYLTADGITGKSTFKKLFSTSVVAADAATSTPDAEETPSRTLRQGDSGDDVKLLQKRLKELGYYKGRVDGSFGSGTGTALATFQLRNGLTDDGVAGSATYRALYSDEALAAGDATATPDTESGEYRNLKLNMSGDDVLRLQNRLVDLNYSLDINGTYDRATRTAVVAFQKKNMLTADGVAGPATQQKLFSASAVGADAEAETLPNGVGEMSGPSKSQVKLLHWFREIKPTIRSGQTVLVYDPASGLGWNLKLYSLGRHADSEPLTYQDTQIMYKAFGNQFTWTEKPVYVRLPNGTWCVASMHDMPHLSGSIKDNGFDGHLCVHFPRDMEETEKNDPKNGVRHQNDIRKFWKKLTGEDIPW